MGSQRPSAQGVILGSIVRFVCQGYDAEGCGGRARLCGAGHAAAWEGLRERKRGRTHDAKGAGESRGARRGAAPAPAPARGACVQKPGIPRRLPARPGPARLQLGLLSTLVQGGSRPCTAIEDEPESRRREPRD